MHKLECNDLNGFLGRISWRPNCAGPRTQGEMSS